MNSDNPSLRDVDAHGEASEGLVNRLKRRYYRHMFLPGALSILINPFYILRRGLCKRIRAITPSVTGDVLDFGCGSKPYESLFQSASSYVGCDVAVSGHSHRESKIDFFYDGGVLPFSDGKFDAVVSFETFEHVFNLQDMLQEISRVLKPDGRLIASIPFAWGEHEAPYDFGRYSSFGIAHLLRAAGYQVESIEKTNGYVLALAQMVSNYVFQHTVGWLPLRIAAQFFLIFPINLAGILFGLILPRDDSYFSNLVVVARKPC